MTAASSLRRWLPTARLYAWEFVAGHAPPPRPVVRAGTRCPGSLGPVSWRLVVNGHAGCEVCGHIVTSGAHPGGGPGPHVCEHDLEGVELP